MKDLSLLYYTANTVKKEFAEKIRRHLEAFNLPIISVSLEAIPFGDYNVCVVGAGEPSIYNVYRQILMGCAVIKTKYVACVEDDCLYHPDHFDLRPSDDETFLYNHSRWRIYPEFYLWKHRRDVTSPGMWNCIAPTDLLHRTLDERFCKYPEKGTQIGWGEPGRYERLLGLPLVKAEKARIRIPNLTFAHRGSLGGVRRIGPQDRTEPELPYWGRAREVWEKYWDGR